ncbi:MAG: MBOAT family O-acyltransferase [Methylobacter sp.]
MLFNSYPFIFLFLPIVLIGFFYIGNRGHHRIAASWLIAASLFFYGWWNPAYLGLILGSILFNYSIGIAITSREFKEHSKKLLMFGLAGDLLLLGYYKYTNFLLATSNSILNTSFNLEAIILPLGISFFTFQKIAYLVDAYKGKTREYGFLNYCLFVIFFPQLIAGPIVHHRDIMVQFSRDHIYKFNYKSFVIGVTIFSIGLFKKVILADGTSEYVFSIFNRAESGLPLAFFPAWGGAFAYSFQLYFDFSGYSDMAIGIAHMFGIRLPMNFNSPYKATSIIEFWRRWHMTLSRFLRDYIYIPLGGSRQGSIRHLLNLLLTMFIGGLWHGAGWTFVLWGTIHGVYLIVNTVWRKLVGVPEYQGDLIRFLSGCLTFFAVMVAWVPFRAKDFDSTMVIWKGMAGLSGFTLPKGLDSKLGDLGGWLIDHNVRFVGVLDGIAPFRFIDVLWFVVLMICTFFMPNTQQFMRKYRPALYSKIVLRDMGSSILWRPTLGWSIGISFLLVYAILGLVRPSEFLYFQF